MGLLLVDFRIQAFYYKGGINFLHYLDLFLHILFISWIYADYFFNNSFILITLSNDDFCR
jgi:hypothetical protein